MQKNSITNKITPCCGLPFSVIYWWVSNLTLNSESDRQYLLTQISQSGVLSIYGWKVLINSGTLEADASLTKAEFLAWFDCGKQPTCEQLKLIIEGFKVGNWKPETDLPINLALIDKSVNGINYIGNVYTKTETDFLIHQVGNLDVKSEIVYEDLKPVNSQAVYDYTTQKINTITDLRNTIGKEEGQIVELLGYYEAGEYSLKYKWTNTQGVDDGGSVINSGSGSWLAIFGEVVTPECFGAKGDGVINDTLAIQRCLNYKATNVVFTKEKYLIDNIYIDGKFGCKIKGSQIVLSDRTDIDLGIEIRSNSWLDITGFHIKGNSSNVSKCRGIYSNSGNQLININIYDNEIDLCSLGISLNSDSGGDLRDCNVFRNKITNILGTDSGFGYGIHLSNNSYTYDTNVNVYNNYIYNSERHSIYMARGRGYNVYNNNVNDHRKNILDSTPKAAIDISRVSNVECYDNKVVNCNGSAIMVTGDLLELLSRVENINIYNNHLESRLLSTLWIGYLTPEIYSELNGINVKGNTIIYNGSETAQSIEFRHGKNVIIEDNVIISNSRGLVLEATSDASNSNYSDVVIIDNNIFKTSSVPIRIGSFGASIASLTITDSNSYGNSTTLFDSSANITNTNISFFDKKNRLNGLTFASNVSLKESLIANDNYFGLVKKSSAVANVSTTPPNQLASQTVTTIEQAQTAINNLVAMVNEMQFNEVELKTKLNAKLTVDRNSGQQAT